MQSVSWRQPRGPRGESRPRVLPRSGLQVVREVGQELGAVIGDKHQILEPATAEAGAVAAGLQGHHVAGEEHVGRATERWRLVHLEPHAMSQRMEVALLEHLAGNLAELRGKTRLLIRLARDTVDLTP